MLRVLQIVRPGNLDVGILLSKTEDNSGRDSPSSASSNHWIVSVEGKSSEEDVSERYLGRILPPRDDEDSGHSSSKSKGKAKKPATRNGSKASKDQAEDEDEPTEASEEEKPKTNGRAKGTTKQAGKTAHKKGTQAKPDERPTRKYATRRGKGDGEELYEGIEKVVAKKRPKAPAAPKVGPDETVIKVKMLTGTLYLYRGLRPRAEFVRIV